MKNIVLFLTYLLAIDGLQGSNLNSFNDKNTVVIVCQGMDGAGNNKNYIGQILNIDPDLVHIVKTPTLWADLGQKNCQKFLQNTIDTLKEGTPFILIGFSQGGGTAINYAAHGKNKSQIKAIIVDSQLASGNQAIYLFAAGLKSMLPFFHYTAPYLAKILTPILLFGRPNLTCFAPSGMQPIKSIHTIDPSIPIIMHHSKNDYTLPFEGAQIMFYARCSADRYQQNAYFFQHATEGHCGMLNKGKLETQKILKHLGIFTNNSPQPYDFSDYQPDHNQFKDAHDALVRQEKIHTRIGYGVNAGLAAGALYAGFKLAKKAGLLDPASPTPACA